MTEENNYSKETQVLAAAIKKTAIAFIEWKEKNNDYVFEHGRFRRWDDDSYITSEQLFDRFEKDNL